MGHDISVIAFLVFALPLSGCVEQSPVEPKPQRSGEPVSGAQFLGRVAVTTAAAAAGQQDVVHNQMLGMADDFRRSFKLADPARAVDRETARQATRSVEGVRSVAWVDAANLFVIVERNALKTERTIDRICVALEPLGDTLGVVVNLQSGEARNAAELQLLVRNCQLAFGDRAFAQDRRDRNVVSDAIWAQHEANQNFGAASKNNADDAIKVIEARTPSVHD